MENNRKGGDSNGAETSESFRQTEINKFVQQDERTLPEGRIMAQRHMYYSDVKATDNRLADYEAFQEILADKNTRTRIGRLLKLTGCGSIVTFASYKKTQEKAHGQIETREYYQTEKIN